MHELSTHDLAERDKATARDQQQRRRQERADLLRLVPVGMALDKDHLLALLSQGPTANVPFIIWRKAAAAGLRTWGLEPHDISRALEITPDRIGATADAPKYWNVPKAVKDMFPALYPPLLPPDTSGRFPEDTHASEYPAVTTDGYRVTGNIDPGIRTRTRGEIKPSIEE